MDKNKNFKITIETLNPAFLDGKEKETVTHYAEGYMLCICADGGVHSILQGVMHAQGFAQGAVSMLDQADALPDLFSELVKRMVLDAIKEISREALIGAVNTSLKETFEDALAAALKESKQ